MDFEQRAQIIEKIRQRYLEGESPTLVSTLMVGPFTSSPWHDHTVVSEGIKPISANRYDQQEASPTKLSELTTKRSIDNLSSKVSPETSTGSAPQADNNQLHEITSDDERTLPYDVYDISDDDNDEVVISSKPC